MVVGQTLHTAPFNATGHPALSLPCGMLPPVEADILTEDDRNIRLPIAFQIVGKYFDETTILRAAGAWEKAYNWKEL
jgi:amidase